MLTCGCVVRRASMASGRRSKGNCRPLARAKDAGPRGASDQVIRHVVEWILWEADALRTAATRPPGPYLGGPRALGRVARLKAVTAIRAMVRQPKRRRNLCGLPYRECDGSG